MKKIFLSLIMTCMVSLAFAQWSTDASVNNTFYSGANSAHGNISATHEATGETYISWFLFESGEMHQKLQKVDVYGVPQWMENGIYISTNTNESALYGTDLITTSDGCAVLMFCDSRTGDYLPYIYKISPSGEFLWGNDGIQMTTVSAMRCYLTPCNDGSVWAGWIDGTVCYARHVSADGQTLGPIITVGNETMTTSFGHILADENNNLLMAYFVGTGNFMWPDRQMFVCKYDVQGNQVWATPTLLMATQNMNFARDLELISDGLGGGYTTCYIPGGGTHQALIFHFDANGNATIPTTGTYVNSNGTVHNYNEVTTVDPNNHNAIVAFITADYGETSRMICVQSVDANGNKLWGEEGIALTEMSGNDILSLAIASVPSGGAIITCINNDNIMAYRVDGNGQKVWNSDVYVSMSLGQKSNANRISGVHNGQLIIPWIENENMVKAQNLKLDGTLGPISQDNPNVTISLGEVTNTTVEATFTPNEACASYYILIGIQSEMEMWMQMMQMTLEQLVQQWGLAYTTQETYTWTDQTPNTEYTIYALPLDATGTTYELQTQIVTTSGGGGLGESVITIELSEITASSVRMIATPNENTAVFFDGLIMAEIFDEIGQDSAIEIIKNNGYPLYEVDDWTWSDLTPNTTYKAIAIGKNADDAWGEATIDEFTTSDATPCDPPTLSSEPGEYEGNIAILLSWTAVEGATLYTVYINGESLGNTENLSVYITGIEAGVEYCFTVTATCAAGESDPSNESCATIPTADSFVITATAGENGTITPSGNVEVEEGASQTFAMSANEGFQIEDVLVDGESVGIVETYTFENVTENHTIAVTFSIKPAVSEMDARFSVYPNPASTQVIIKGENIESIFVYNTLGQLVEKIDAQNDSSIILNINNYCNGLCIFRIHTKEGEIISKKIMITH